MELSHPAYVTIPIDVENSQSERLLRPMLTEKFQSAVVPAPIAKELFQFAVVPAPIAIDLDQSAVELSHIAVEKPQLAFVQYPIASEKLQLALALFKKAIELFQIACVLLPIATEAAPTASAPTQISTPSAKILYVSKSFQYILLPSQVTILLPVNIQSILYMFVFSNQSHEYVLIIGIAIGSVSIEIDQLPIKLSNTHLASGISNHVNGQKSSV